MADEKSILDSLNSIMDGVESGIGKAEKVLGKVYVPGDEDSNSDAEDAEIISESPASDYVFGGIPGSDGRGIIWHIYAQPGPITVCGRKYSPESWWRPNATSKEAILCCFGCLSRLAQLQRKELGP